MRNWHHKVIRFFYVFMFLLGFGQMPKKYYDSICKANYIDDSIKYLKLKKEAKNVNYKKLTKKIVNDIKWDSLKKSNLIFSINDVRKRTIAIGVDASDFYSQDKDCSWRNQSSKNPNYNDTIFWSKKNINFIVKKYKKNLIPKIFNTFIYDITETYFVIGLNNFIDYTRRQKVGNFINHWGDNRKFFYFPYIKNENLILNNEQENYDQLILFFTNELGNIVKVEYKYGDRASIKQYSVEKKYQYINKEWAEIKDE